MDEAGRPAVEREPAPPGEMAEEAEPVPEGIEEGGRLGGRRDVRGAQEGGAAVRGEERDDVDVCQSRSKKGQFAGGIILSFRVLPAPWRACAPH